MYYTLPMFFQKYIPTVTEYTEITSKSFNSYITVKTQQHYMVLIYKWSEDGSGSGKKEAHEICLNMHSEDKKLSWCWQQARRVLRSVEVNKHGTIPHVTYSFLLCNSNFVFKTCRFYDISLQKISWPWNGVKGHSRSLRVVSFDRLCMVSY